MVVGIEHVSSLKKILNHIDKNLGDNFYDILTSPFNEGESRLNFQGQTSLKSKLTQSS